MQRKAVRSEAERVSEMTQRPGTANVKVKSTLATARKKDCDHHDTDKEPERLTKRKREREREREERRFEPGALPGAGGGGGAERGRTRGLGGSGVYFSGEFSPNFDLKNIISTHTKDFSSGKRKSSNSSDFKFLASFEFYFFSNRQNLVIMTFRR